MNKKEKYVKKKESMCEKNNSLILKVFFCLNPLNKGV